MYRFFFTPPPTSINPLRYRWDSCCVRDNVCFSVCVKVGWGIAVGVTVSGSELGSLRVSCCIYVSLLRSNSGISCCGCLSGIGCVFCVSGNSGCMFGVSGCCGIGVS